MDIRLSVHMVLTFYLFSIGFRYVTPVGSEGHEHQKAGIELFNYLLVEVKNP
jgi:hypothetical protein